MNVTKEECQAVAYSLSYMGYGECETATGKRISWVLEDFEDWSKFNVRIRRGIESQLLTKQQLLKRAGIEG